MEISNQWAHVCPQSEILIPSRVKGGLARRERNAETHEYHESMFRLVQSPETGLNANPIGIQYVRLNEINFDSCIHNDLDKFSQVGLR